jgi:hypothetical protein
MTSKQISQASQSKIEDWTSPQIRLDKPATQRKKWKKKERQVTAWLKFKCSTHIASKVLFLDGQRRS